MPYKNVYEEKSRHGLISRVNNEEPERDPKKIAEIYKRQLPGADEYERQRAKLDAEKERIIRARTANRGIKKSILDRS